jgi:hypothetical protein
LELHNWLAGIIVKRSNGSAALHWPSFFEREPVPSSDWNVPLTGSILVPRTIARGGKF